MKMRFAAIRLMRPVVSALLLMTWRIALAAGAVNTPLLTVDVREDAMIVPLQIAGKRYPFLLDTGASQFFIDNHVAQALTQPAPEETVPAIYQRNFRAGIHSVDGVLKPQQMQLWRPLDVALGRYTVPAADPWVGIDLAPFTEVLGVKIAGVIGADMFRQLNWQVDNQRHRLTIFAFPPATLGWPHCLPYRDGFGEAPTLILSYLDSTLSMTVDTGAGRSYAGQRFIDFASRAGDASQGEKEMRSLSATGVSHTRGYRLNALRFNQMPLGSFSAVLNPRERYALGMNFFARFDDYLFIPSQMLFCYRAQNFTRDEPLPLRQLSLRYIADRVEFFYNAPDEIGRLGLQNGDVLLEVNGERVRPQDIDRLRHRLRSAPSGQLALTIERHGKQSVVRL